MHDYIAITKPTDTPKTRTVGAIALYPLDNNHEGWIFISLATGKTIHGNIWTVLPVGEDVIARVHQISLEEKQPLISKKYIQIKTG